MEVERLAIPDVVRLRPTRHGDARGWFTETYNARRAAEAGVASSFVQDNHAFSAAPFTLRGLHAQTPPHAQAKLVRASRGAIRDVAVDAREGSATYGQWVGATLSAEAGDQLFVPAGFLHGYVTLEPDTEVQYKTDAYYAPDHEVVVAWNDAGLAIDWGVDPAQVIVSARDAAGAAFGDVSGAFALHV